MITQTENLIDDVKKLSLATNHALWPLVEKLISMVENKEMGKPRIKRLRQDDGDDHVIITI